MIPRISSLLRVGRLWVVYFVLKRIRLVRSRCAVSGGLNGNRLSPDAAGKNPTLNGELHNRWRIPADFRYQSGNFHNSDAYVPIVSER
jgi:hypothetical protein